MTNDKTNQPASADTLADIALSAVKRVPLSSDELRELAAKQATDETEAAPAPQPLDLAAIRERVEYIEAQGRKGRHLPPVLLPCMNRENACANNVEIADTKQLDDWLSGRNLCTHCAASRFQALPPDKQDAITNLNSKASQILFSGNWALMSNAEYDRKLAQAQRFWDEARLLENAWVYNIDPNVNLPFDDAPAAAAQDEVDDDLPF